MWHPWYPACIFPPLRSDVLSNCSSPSPLSLLKCILYISKSRMLWREHKFMLPAAVRRGLKRTQVASSSSSTTSIPLVGTSSASSSPSYPNRKKKIETKYIYIIQFAEETKRTRDLWEKVQFRQAHNLNNVNWYKDKISNVEIKKSFSFKKNVARQYCI